jgi:polyisoprenoid-binding protein YceI
MLARSLLAAALIAGPLAGPARADSYVFDKNHTFVRFTWNHLGLSHQSGRVGDVEGRLEFDAEHPDKATVEVALHMGGLSSGLRELDGALKSREYFDVAGHPVATFKSTSVVPTGPRTAKVTGDLTLVGQTHPVTLDVAWNFSGEHPLSKINPVYTDMFYSGFSARGTLYRSDWGLTRTIPYVSDEIELAIEAEAKRTAVDLPGGPAAAPGEAGPANPPPN